MRLAFMGTPDFAVPTLRALIEAGHEIAAVYTQPPRPAGRGKKDRKSAVHIAAEAAGLPVKTPKSMKDPSETDVFNALELDCAVVVAYGQILPQAILDAPKYGCINVHASLLPRWRGAAPIHRAIMAGDKRTGVCIMQMEAGLDTGPVILKDEVTVQPTDTTASLHDTLSGMGGALINDALQALESGAAFLAPQSDEGVTYAKKIEKAEARIDWAKPAAEIDRQVRGLYPFPGAWTEMNGERIKVLGGCVRDVSASAGVTFDEALTVGCGEGAYQIITAQRAGKGPVSSSDLLRGFPVPSGTKVG